MGHKHRIEVAGGLYHVTSRGNARQPIFLDDFDYATFLQWLSKTIAMNPVRAGLVADPADWPWSSYRATAGLERVPPYLRVDRVRSLFAAAGSSGAEGFRDFVAAANVTPDLAA